MLDHRLAAICSTCEYRASPARSGPTGLRHDTHQLSLRRLTMRGHCLCGNVSFEIDPPVQTCVNCHCESCRRQCSAPVTTYIGIPDEQWRWTGTPPQIFVSSPGVQRTFCGTCGTPVSFRSNRMSGIMHFFAAVMEDPERFKPTLHVAFEEKLPWLILEDELPAHVGPDYTKA